VTRWLVLVLLLAPVLPARAADGDLLARVRVLTAPALAGRGSGTPEGLAAAETLAAWFAAAGLQPAFDGSWLQEFPLAGEGLAGEDLAGRVAHNVGGLLPGSGALADRYLVVGAHHDHLGRVDPAGAGAGPPAADAYYPGANDNASGVTVLVELARRAARGGDRRAVLFVGFGAEEVGLQGSAWLVDHLPVERGAIDAMINLDTVGRLADGKLLVSGVGTSPRFADLVAAAAPGGPELSLAGGGWSGSDHMVFNTREIPVLFLFGGAYPQYNRPGDTADSLDPAALAAVAGFAGRLVDAVRRAPGDLPWVRVGGKDLREDDDGTGNRQTWLGTLPDFTEDVTGYRLADVFDDSPAARAGLAKGDVIVEFGGRPVTDLATFTRALRENLPGDPVEIVALRGGRTLRFTVVLGDRADRK